MVNFWQNEPLLYIILSFVFAIFVHLIIKKKSKSISHNLKEIDLMNGHDFEYYCNNKILKAHGFSFSKVTKGSGDFGVDIIANKDGKKHVFQIKRYKSRVGVAAIQEIVSGKVYYKAECAYVITNSFFTKQAIEMAKKCNVILIDRNNFYKNKFF